MRVSKRLYALPRSQVDSHTGRHSRKNNIQSDQFHSSLCQMWILFLLLFANSSRSGACAHAHPCSFVFSEFNKNPFFMQMLALSLLAHRSNSPMAQDSDALLCPSPNSNPGFSPQSMIELKRAADACLGDADEYNWVFCCPDIYYRQLQEKMDWAKTVEDPPFVVNGCKSGVHTRVFNSH